MGCLVSAGRRPPEAAPSLHALGIDISDEELDAIKGAEPVILSEEAERRAKAQPIRRRAGPLVPAERTEIMRDSIGQLRRGLLTLLLATADAAEVNTALAHVALQLRSTPPNLDNLSAALWQQIAGEDRPGPRGTS
jgi:hypothetical protein